MWFFWSARIKYKNFKLRRRLKRWMWNTNIRDIDFWLSKRKKSINKRSVKKNFSFWSWFNAWKKSINRRRKIIKWRNWNYRSINSYLKAVKRNRIKRSKFF